MVDAALDGQRPSVDIVRGWHRTSVKGVRLAEPAVAGGFRGEGPAGTELPHRLAIIGLAFGELPDKVRIRVEATFKTLEERLDRLDSRLEAGDSHSEIYADVIELCAWIHGQWVRIHPFADHNGSTARLLTINIGLLYGVPLKLPGKPRTAMPEAGLDLDYGAASGAQMFGNDQNMVVFMHRIAAM